MLSFETVLINIGVVRDLLLCAICKIHCEISQSRVRSLQISDVNDPNLTLTQPIILTLAKSRSAFFTSSADSHIASNIGTSRLVYVVCIFIFVVFFRNSKSCLLKRRLQILTVFEKAYLTPLRKPLRQPKDLYRVSTFWLSFCDSF